MPATTVRSTLGSTVVVAVEGEIVGSGTHSAGIQVAVGIGTNAVVPIGIVALPGPKGDTGEGLTPGGSSGEFLIKTGSDDYDADWFPFLNTMVPTDSTHRWTTDAQIADFHAAASVDNSTGLSISGQQISLATASAGNSGSLSAANWITFNAKCPSDRTISTTAPLTGGGALDQNRTFAIPVATSLADGYLAKEDWTTFNGKQDALGFTPVTDERTVSTTAPLTGGGALSGNLTLAMAAATASADGYLTKEDWATFNGKQAAGSYLTTTTGLKLDQSTPQTFSGGAFAGNGLFRITAGLLGVDTNTYLTAESDTLASVTSRGASTTVNLSINGASDATELTLQSFAGQTATVPVLKAGNVSGGTLFSVFPQGNISLVGGTTTGITDILVNPAAKASGNFFDFQIATVSKARIEYDGTIKTPKLYGLNGVALILSTGATNGALTVQNESYNGTASKTAITLLGGTNSMTAGTFVGLKLSSIYNQATGTAANTDFEINRTNTAVGSGLQLFWDCKLNTVSIASMDTAGNLRISSDAAGLKLGAGLDMLVSYDGTIGKIDSSLVAASDLHITTGAAKTLVLDTVVYKDQLGAALSLQQTGSGISRNIPEGTVDYTTGANQADYMVENFQFNHDRKAATPVYVHIHWMQAETNTPNWAIQYRWQLGETAKTTSWTAAKWTSNAFTRSTGTLNQITSFAALMSHHDKLWRGFRALGNRQERTHAQSLNLLET